MVRLQKYLADAGVASRRASEEIIVAGRVTVNGKIAKELGTKVDPGADRVAVDGRALKAKRKLYLALHKPRGYLCARTEVGERRVLADLLPPEWNNLYSVGRLDYDSEGLIFMTNDGDFCLHLTHPRYGVRKYYRVTVKGRVDPEQIAPMTRGVIHDGEKLRAERARVLSRGQGSSLLEVELLEGKNREVRRLCETLGLEVLTLQRTQIGPIKLGELRVGRWRALSASEITALLRHDPPAAPARRAG